MAKEAYRRPGGADPDQIQTRAEFACELKRLKEQAGLTIRRLAKAIDVPFSTVGGYFSGRHLPPANEPALLRNLLAECGITDVVVVEKWVEALRRVHLTPGRQPAGAPVPYPGLVSFEPEDGDWFYGREKLTAEVIEHLRAQSLTGGMLFVVGSSGSGKSSLLRAGMIPALRSGALGGSWPVALFTPGTHPLVELDKQLGSLAGSDHQAAADRVVLVVDQFEEIFSACPDESERRAFITALCAPDRGLTTLVVIGMRADFYSHALQYQELASALQSRQLMVQPMTEAELRRAIELPARQAALDLEDDLIELLFSDLAPAGGNGAGDAYGAGNLPLLAHALRSTWDLGRHGRLTVANYLKSGRIKGAVAHTADEVYDQLTEAEKATARQIFVRLVHVTDDTADTRRRVVRSELLRDEDARRVLDLFIGKRLLTARTDTIEIAHEALLSAWPKLRDWIDKDRVGIHIRGQLSIAAQIWQDTGRHQDYLYRSGNLATASDWAAGPGHRDDLTALEGEFLDASVQLRRTEEHLARRRTRRLQVFIAALTALSVLIAALAVFAFQQESAATHQRNLAISRQVAIDANDLRKTDIALAMQLSLAAFRVSPTPEARSSLLDSYSTPAVTRVLGTPGVMQSAAFTRDGTTMATGGENSAAQLWNMADPGRPTALGRPLAGATGTIFSLAFSPDGQILASGSSDKTIRLWNVTNPAKAVPYGPPLTGPASTVYSVAFSPDGHLLAAGSADGTVRLWRVTNPGDPVPLGQVPGGPAGYVQSVAFSPDGHLLAAGSADGTVRLWDMSHPSHPVRIGPPMTGGTGTVFSVAFSPDGRILAAGDADEKVRLWTVTRPGHPIPDGTPLTGPTGWVNSIAFSPDGQRLAAASSDNNVWIWNLATHQVLLTLPHPAPVTSVTFLRNDSTVGTSAADGVARIWRIPGPVVSAFTQPVFTVAFARDHVMAVTSADNTARLWNVADPRQPVPLGHLLTDSTRSGAASGAAALSPDGRILVVGAANGTCQIWEVRNPARPVPLARLSGPTLPIQAITFSPDGRILAIGGNNRAVWLWDLADPAQPVLLGKPLTGPGNYVLSIAFSPSGHLLAAADADELVHLWDIADPRRPVALRPIAGTSSYVYSVAFSPDGRVLVTGSADDQVRLYDVADPRHPLLLGRPLTGPTNYVYSVAFSPDGKTLAATAGDGSIWLWDVSTASQPVMLATLTGPVGAVFIDAFAPGGNILATGGNDGVARLWNTSPEQVADYVCSIVGTPITRAEWQKYIPGLPYKPPCPASR